MSNLVIVALPAEDDYVNQISSEKVPHMTLLFLGDDASKVKNLSMILDFVKHASERSLTRFDLEVDRRGELGDVKADVLFFSKSKWSGFGTVKDYRSYLLKDDNIRTAYDSTEQFPEFTPHLTLGYPDTPAKPDKRDYPGISYVNFDRIAVWFGEYEGIEFPLRNYDWDWDWDMAMSDIVDNEITHFGKKGMKWGVRTKNTLSVATGLPSPKRSRQIQKESKAKRVGPQKVTVTDKRKKLKTRGGQGFKAHPDAVRARTLGQKGKKSGLKALSDQELQDYSKRLNLEQSVKRLNYNDKSPPKKFILTLLGQTGKTQANEAANQVASKAVKKVIAAAA